MLQAFACRATLSSESTTMGLVGLLSDSSVSRGGVGSQGRGDNDDKPSLCSCLAL